MQSTAAPGLSTSLSPTPSYAEKHQGFLGDYEAMLSLVRNHQIPLQTLADSLIKPRLCSPMALENETGQRALHTLIQDKNYQALCKTLSAPHYHLIVTLKDGKALYETLSRNRETTIQIPLNNDPSWNGLRAKIEKTARLLGGQIRFDGQVTFARMTWFYGITPCNRQNTEQRHATMNALEEKRAHHTLGLGHGINIDALSPHTENLITDTVRQFLPTPHTPLLAYLGASDIDTLTTTQIRAKPSAYLEAILQSTNARKLATRLLQVLGWFGGRPGEDTAAGICTKLLAHAIRLWLEKEQNESPDSIAGYPWQRSSNWGKSYGQIRAEFEAHLLSSKRAASVNESILLARLYQSLFPPHFQIHDIPSQLPYRSSTVWVNFAHGVGLADAIDPTLLQRLSFQQLVDFPGQYASEATADDLKLVTLTRLKPMLEWAVTNGLVAHKADEHYTLQDIQTAAEKLDFTIDSLTRAVNWLDSRPPERLNIARLKMAKLFADGRFVTDGRKLVKEASTYAAPVTRLSGPIARLAPQTYTFTDVYAAGQLTEHKWFVTRPDGKVITDVWFKIDHDTTLQTNFAAPGFSAIAQQDRKLPDIEQTFKTHFDIYLSFIRSSYRTLITHLLASLPLADRQALEYGVTKVYTLRKETTGIEANNESEDKTLPLRARNGFILETTSQRKTSYYELLPRAGVIRPRPDIQPHHIGAERKIEKWRISRGSAVSVDVLRHKTLPFDWDAHVKGTLPGAHKECQAILDPLGGTFGESNNSDANHTLPRTLESKVTLDLARYICEKLLFVDEKQLYDSCYGETEFDRQKARREKNLEILKMFVPFWGSIEDLASGDRDRLVSGAFGLFTDFVAFARPMGKFASGSLKLVSAAGKLSIGKALPAFATLTGSLLNATLNPLDGIASLLRAGSQSVYRFSKKGYLSLKTLSGRAGQYDFVQGMAQATDPGRWRPLTMNDQLSTVRGVDDVPVRNTTATGSADYRLIDPLSSRPYGPGLGADVSPGRSHFNTRAQTDIETLVELPENARVLEVLEADGSRLFYVDGVPYRLKAGTLRRISHRDDNPPFRKLACRVRRAPDEACKTRYVVQDKPAERPPAGEFSTELSWAPWFGDATFYPSTPKHPNDRALLAFEGKIYELKDGKLNTYKGKPQWIGLSSRIPIPKETITATLEFQTGLYGGIKVTGSAEKIDDIHQTGALIIPSIDEQFTYIFTRLNTDDYYMTRLLSTESVESALSLKRLGPSDLTPGSLGEELQRVYIGSLNANNAARIYGRDQVERALDKIDEISIPIGAPSHPPSNMKWLKVSTYPAEAVLFDRRTRMIVSDLPNGAAVWQPTTQAPEAIQKSTASIFNALFTSPSIAGPSQSTTRAVTINDAMRELQKTLPTKNQKNIAFAHVITASGNNEIYVSVSGIEDYTRHLPLFKSHSGYTQVNVKEATYFNVDGIRNAIDPASLTLSADGKLLAIPHLMDAPGTSDRLSRVTSADSESKLIAYISEKYPNPEDIKSITLATTLPPCESCAIVMKEFGHERGAAALNVIWGQRRKRPATEMSSSTESD
ncbi:deaminase domain-containing protein [Pseudomonas sp. A214]|uniref:deaminase domain-containing protein n=2 Tax=unclassified Pseudomonas TaxID=196821 RepID=UPI0009537741|nr:deaminase domain-containing protein [Pseudomonas sp. A214]SIS11636.1 The BURPS668_1122 family of deaminases [Pseudomonas sp. A214]